MPTSTIGDFMFTKPSVSQLNKHKRNEGNDPSRLQRLASATNITKAFTRKSSHNKENIPTQAASPCGLDPLREDPDQSLAAMPPPSYTIQRPRRVSSPHPRKEILPRSITISNLPGPRPRLPSSHTSASLLSRRPTPSPTAIPKGQKTSPAKPFAKRNRRSLIPTPNRGRADESHVFGGRQPKWQTREGEVKGRTLQDLAPNSEHVHNQVTRAATSPSPDRKEDLFRNRTFTPQKLKHRNSKSPGKSPQRRQSFYDDALNPPKRLHSAYDVVHHGLLKTLSPSANPPPILDRLEGKRMSLASLADLDGATGDQDNDTSASVKRLSLLKASLAGRNISRQNSLSTTIHGSPDAEADVEVDDEEDFRLVREAQCSAYWTGRYMSLNDKFMNESHDTPKPSVKCGAQIMHNREEQRAKRIMDSLDQDCLTEEARRSLWQFKVQLASSRGYAGLLTSHANSHINGIGDNVRLSPASTEYTSERGSLEGLGMPTAECLPKGPEKIETKPSWASTSTLGSYKSFRSQWSLMPPPLNVLQGMELGPPAATSYSRQSELSSSPKSLNDVALSIGSVLENTPNDKNKRRMSFVEKLIGKSRRENSTAQSTSSDGL